MGKWNNFSGRRKQFALLLSLLLIFTSVTGSTVAYVASTSRTLVNTFVPEAQSSTEPSAPTEPPTEPPIEPTEPTTEPTVPPTEPTVPPTEPTVPPTEPSVPPTEPTVPPTEPTEPTAPATQPTELPTEPIDPDAPPTGDDSNIGLYAVMMFVSLAAVIILLVIGEKKGGRYLR